MSASLKLVHVNIEGNKHLDLVLPFLKEQQPDIVCLQELCEGDIPQCEAALGGTCLYVRMSRGSDGLTYGIGIVSKFPVAHSFVEPYGGSSEALPDFDKTTIETIHDSQRFSLMVCDVEKGGEVFRVGTTHFPVTEKGQPTDFQHEDMHRLLALLEGQGELVFTGDFNAPRGGEIFGMLAAAYTDNVPPQYMSSIDGGLHRAGSLPYMVDGIFSTSEYIVSDVSMHTGVSDHCALVATIARREEEK